VFRDEELDIVDAAELVVDEDRIVENRQQRDACKENEKSVFFRRQRNPTNLC
jgi:hypothetical protein